LKHAINVLVENEFGVLARVAGLFSGRGFNIESLSGAETPDPAYSQMTIVTSGNDQIIEQICKQLNKLINVLKVTDLVAVEHIERELVLVKIAADRAARAEIMHLLEVFHGRIVDLSHDDVTVEVTGTRDKNADFLNLLSAYEIKEVMRTGSVAMMRTGSAADAKSKQKKGRALAAANTGG